MPSTYPTTLDTFSNPIGTDKVNNAVAGLVHSTQHAQANDAIEALEAKVGATNSAVTTSHDYKLGEVTGSDKAVGKSATQTLTNKTIQLGSTTLVGTVPVANGGLGVALTDPNADRMLFWDDSAGQYNHLTAGTGLNITGTTLSVSSPVLTETFTAKENLTAGDMVGVANNFDGNVSKAKAEYTTASTGAIKVYSTQVEISTNKLVVAFNSTGGSPATLSVAVSDVDITDYSNNGTLGTPVNISTDVEPTNLWDICKLDTNKFLVVYSNTSTNTVVRTVIATVSGTTITLGTPQVAFTMGGAVLYIRCCSIDTNKAVVTGFTNTSNRNTSVAFTVSGTTATFGATLNHASTNNVTIIGKTNTNAFTAVFTTVAEACTVSGTTITAGTPVTIFTGGATAERDALDFVSPANNTFITSARISGGGVDSAIVACTVSGTTITAGTPLVVSNSSPTMNLYTKSATEILLGVINTTQKIQKTTLSGTTLSTPTSYINSINTQISSSGFRQLTNMGSYYIFMGFTAGYAVTYWIDGMSNNYIGVAQSTVSQGASVEVLLNGIDTHQSGLVTGNTYEVVSGGLSEISTKKLITYVSESETVKATSPTSIKV